MSPPESRGATVGSPWGDLGLGDGETRSLDLGTLRLVVRRTATEVWLQVQRSPRFKDPEDGEWLRWALSATTAVSVQPAMPDRLLVVSHEHNYHLPPRREAKVYVRIPLFVQVVVEGRRNQHVLMDVPSIVLSNTWWGTFEEGALGYWLKTKARAAVRDDLFLPHFGVCPLLLVNDSDDALPVQRFALQVPHLSLFKSGTKNWTDEVRVRYAGSTEGSEINFGEDAPAEAPGAELLSPPRMRPGRGLQVWTFDRLRSLSPLGF